MKKPDFSEEISQLIDLGEEHARDRDWIDYPQKFGLEKKHIPELIAVALDEEMYFLEEELNSGWAHIHAWRTLGQLKRILNPLFACFSQKIASFFLFRA